MERPERPAHHQTGRLSFLQPATLSVTIMQRTLCKTDNQPVRPRQPVSQYNSSMEHDALSGTYPAGRVFCTLLDDPACLLYLYTGCLTVCPTHPASQRASHPVIHPSSCPGVGLRKTVFGSVMRQRQVNIRTIHCKAVCHFFFFLALWSFSFLSSVQRPCHGSAGCFVVVLFFFCVALHQILSKGLLKNYKMKGWILNCKTKSILAWKPPFNVYSIFNQPVLAKKREEERQTGWRLEAVNVEADDDNDLWCVMPGFSVF